MSAMNRRRFLYVVTSASGAAVVATAWRGANEQTELENAASDLQRVERSAVALGSTVTLIALHADAQQAREAIDAAFEELELVESLMSLYRQNSQLTLLNRLGELDHPHPYLVEVLRAAAAMSERTGGAFDITVQALWDLYASKSIPSQAEINSARRRVDWRRVEVTASRVRLRGQGTAVTLNGIAQGFAADRVAAVLRERGIEHALIDTGEIGTLGAKPGHDAWTIGIQHPRDEQAFLALAGLADRCLATSGDYETVFKPNFQGLFEPQSDEIRGSGRNRLEDHLRYRDHHLFDPRTGYSATELCSVSVVAETAMAADALSTAAFVLGPKAGLELIRLTPGADALLACRDGRTFATSGFPFQLEG